MQTIEFFRKLTSRGLWLNLFAMAAVIVLLVFGTIFALDVYTHHGESISVPDVRNRNYETTVEMLEDMGFIVNINDTGYVKKLPPGTILEQLPAPGTKVKSGRVIYLTINAADSPTLVVPDIIDNCSLREAMARLSALGFKLGEPKRVPGEKDWVYGLTVNGRSVVAGDRVSIESQLIIQAGNGQRDASDSIYVTDMPEEFNEEPEHVDVGGSSSPIDAGGEGDDFEVVE